MPTEFKLPELGENVESGDVTKVLVAPGDSIAKDQAVVELETEKATIEVPSPTAGTVKQVHVKQGQKVKVG
ncbi:MAG: biotin/lipoyl-containing protein, partial [Candidatus Acidiferrales bacterium]